MTTTSTKGFTDQSFSTGEVRAGRMKLAGERGSFDMNGKVFSHLSGELGKRPESSSFKTLQTYGLRSGGLRSGLTLVELLVVLFIGLVVTVMAFSIYRSSTGQYINQESALRLQQNIRNAVDVIASNARMAGNGLTILGPNIDLVQFYGPTKHTITNSSLTITKSPGWFANPDAPSGESGVRAIYGVDGGTDRADSITFFHSEIERPSPIGRAVDYKNGIINFEDNLPDDSLLPGDLGVLVNSSQAVIFETGDYEKGEKKVPVRKGGRFTSDAPPKNFTVEGSLLYNFRKVKIITYFIDEASSRLMADYHDQSITSFDDPSRGAITLANDIVDLQVYYYFDGEQVTIPNISNNPDIGSVRFANNRVNALAIGLTGRAAASGTRTHYVRPELFNRRAGTETDTRRFSTVMKMVYLRNSFI
ncbi:MAG: hypothetical protein LBS44_00240 [Deltaproteobacteria bacterium]|jgi:type II secretory pathway pseudopilin PulG|nr:hypothetical protein [Deltaproteobacteria bacterium]